MKLIMMGLMLLAGSSAMAITARTVNIALPSGSKELSLSNPTTDTVNYDVTCYAADGTTTLTSTNQNLVGGRSVSHVPGFADIGQCAAGAPNTFFPDLNGKKVYICTGSTAVYAAAQTICGAGQKFCYPIPQYVGCSVYMNSYDAWVKQEPSTEKSNDGGCTFNPTVGTDYFYGAGCTYAVRKIGTPTHRIEGLNLTSNASETHGAVCCEDTQAGGLCKVTINSGTPANGALSSPSFKGGAPF